LEISHKNGFINLDTNQQLFHKKKKKNCQLTVICTHSAVGNLTLIAAINSFVSNQEFYILHHFTLQLIVQTNLNRTIMRDKKLNILVVAALIFAASCSKPATDTTAEETTVTATVAKNGTYNYKLASGSTITDYSVSYSSAHEAITGITTDATGDAIFQYTAPAGYIGRDTVVVRHHHPHHHHGGAGCHNGDTTSNKIIFNITVDESNSGG
jgi:hypothetical protein